MNQKTLIFSSFIKGKWMFACENRIIRSTNYTNNVTAYVKNWHSRLTGVYKSINPFHVTGLFGYLLKTSENLWFRDVFRGYRKRPVTWNGLTAYPPTIQTIFFTISEDPYNLWNHSRGLETNKNTNLFDIETVN